MNDASRRSAWSRMIVILCVLIVLQVNAPHVSAADHWDTALEHINLVHDDVAALKVVVLSETQHIKDQRTKNNDALKWVNAKIKVIDLKWINSMQIEVDQTLRKHSPLLEQFTALSKQATAAKQNKDKKLADLLDLKRNKILTSVLAARTDIKSKKEALSAARRQRASKVKLVKDVLAPVQKFKKQITEENKTVAAARHIYSASEKRYKTSVKQGNAVTAAEDITLMYDQMQIIHTSQQKVYDWEKQISQVIMMAESKIPK
ncbi:hypothetical protein [Paenibacillus sp. IHBB 10380]|uniref:hypothetical protein n=1 Tax=Paenibacillus sp. IHBB 10380 TaxID=1566358 RepID=UPI0005CFE901|nr:hypothetical protein [Paenibacillus sp. IHBB 10380]AJS57325.1 hypothetical protein UB51_01110 [Paenibacillus sp. IHBB 10380]